MSSLKAILDGLRLLAPKAQRKLLAATLIQVTTTLLDLAGVLLLGLTGALAVTTVQGMPPSGVVQQVIARLGLDELSDTEVLALFAVVAAVALLAKSLISALLLRRIFGFLATQQAHVASRMTRALLHEPLTFLQERSSQKTAYALVQGASDATLVVLGQSVIVVAEVSLLVVLSAALLLLSPIVAMGSIVFFAAVAWALQFGLGSWAARSGREKAAADILSLDAVQEAMAAYREVAVANRQHHYVDRIQEQRFRAARVAADLQFIWAFPKYVFEVALVLGGLVLAGFLFSSMDTVAAVGTMTLFVAAATRVMPSILRLQGAALTIRSAHGTATETFELAQALEDRMVVLTPQFPTQQEDLRAEVQAFEPSVILSHVTFTYPTASQPAVCDVTLTVPAGSSLALVGPTGAGKSTLADVCLGLVRPQSGKVLLGGLAPAEVIRRCPGVVAYVPQNVALANASVRENVALGLPPDTIDDESVWDALRLAHLDKVIAEGHAGLNTAVGERGLKFSGGQRQRLGIARALYTRPRLIVLDEATSALDAETEHAVSLMLGALEGAVTTVVIAHRLTTVRDADCVAYMDEGRVVATGTFDEVRSAVPAFDRQAGIMGLK